MQTVIQTGLVQLVASSLLMRISHPKKPDYTQSKLYLL